MVDWVCYRFVTVKRVAYGGVHRLGFCGRVCLEVRQGKPRLLVVSDHTKLTISTVLSCGVVPFFHKIRWNKQFLKHSIKQCMHSVLGKINLFRLGRGGVLPPPPPSGYAPEPAGLLKLIVYFKICERILEQLFHMTEISLFVLIPRFCCWYVSRSVELHLCPWAITMMYRS